MAVVNNSYNKLFLIFYFFSLGSFPPIILSLFHASSLAPGLIILSILFFVSLCNYFPNPFRISKKLFIFVHFLFLYMAVQMFIVGLFSFKSFVSIPFLFFIVCVAYMFAMKLKDVDDKSLEFAISQMIIILLVIGFFNIIVPLKIPGYTHSKAVVPFSEPSHYALFSGPMFISYFVLNKTFFARLVVLLSMFLLAALFPNMTMLIYLFITLLLVVRINIWQFLLCVVSILLMINFVLRTPYFIQRVTVTDSNRNLSALVYIQGVQDAYNALSGTYGLGLGLQMLGTQPPSEAAELISAGLGIGGGELNREDGGFLAAKIIAEFGILGVFVVLFFLHSFVKSFFLLRRIIKEGIGHFNIKTVFFNSIIFSFSVEVFVRGYGYFSPGVFMFIVSVLYSKKNNRSKSLFKTFESVSEV